VPKLRETTRQGHAYVILDGTQIPIDHIAVDRPCYPGKHR
jgi:hypothetical protein